MTDQNPEAEAPQAAAPEPLKLDVPLYDYVKHSATDAGVETREGKA